MVEVLRYGLIGKQDIRFGAGTFTVTLADGREVVLDEVQLSHLVSAIASGAVVFMVPGDKASETVIGGDASNLFWDNVQKRLGIGTATPAQVLDVVGRIAASLAVIAPSAGPSASQQHTLPAVASDTIVLLAAVQTLSNKTLTSPTLTAPDLGGSDMTAVDEVAFNDAAADATAAGRLRRNAAVLTFHDGTAVRTLVSRDATETLQNKTLDAPVLSNVTLSGATVSGAAPTTPAANVLYTDSVVKGWVETSGAGAWTIDDDLNVSSITDNGVGDFTINWATAFASANYVVIGTAIDNTSNRVTSLTEQTLTAKSTTAVRMKIDRSVENTVADPTQGVSVIAIGDQ